MKFGCCVGIPTIAADAISNLAASGYDYAELPLAQVVELTDSRFDELLKIMDGSGIGCYAMNIFFPGHIRLTGNSVRVGEIDEYVSKAFERANRLGAEVIVFGSSGARNVEQGFCMKEASSQLCDHLSRASKIASPYGIKIAIESLNRRESNIINSLHEAADLAAAVNSPDVGVLIDLYHMDVEQESLDVIEELKKENVNFVHVHIADAATDRGFPLNKERFVSFAKQLESINYDKNISIEGNSKDFNKEIKLAKNVMDSLFRKP